MKYFSMSPTAALFSEFAQYPLIVIGNLLRLCRHLLRRKGRRRRSVVLVDGFLIGDAVLLRPLVLAVMEKYESCYDIMLVGGAHCRYVYEDCSANLTIVECQFPWATYDYSVMALVKLVAVWWRIWLSRPAIVVETRGDVRSISWAYLLCSDKLVGFAFTGGAKLLTDIVPDDGAIAPIYSHHERIASSLGLSIDAGRVLLGTSPARPGSRRVGLSFSGSQPLRNLPVEVADVLTMRLVVELNADLTYIVSPAESNDLKTLMRHKYGGRVELIEGGFGEYWEALHDLDLYIGMDSGGGHLAALFGIPSVILFGTQHSRYCRPIGNHPVLCLEPRDPMACRPCNGRACTNAVSQACYKKLQFDALVRFGRRYLGGAAIVSTDGSS